MQKISLEELLRQFNLGDYVVRKDEPRRIYRIIDIFDDSPAKAPWSEDYELELLDIRTFKKFYVTHSCVVKLDEDHQYLIKLLYD
jgi:hypothetical protein